MSSPQPLYWRRDAAQTLHLLRAPHPGLRFERYPALMNANGSIPADERHQWLKSYLKTAIEPQHLARHHARLKAAVQAQRGQQRTFTTVGRLAIGLGNPNAGGIGLSLDHALGMPVIPGSTVKGLTLAGARLLDEAPAAEQLLGEAADATRSGFAGSVAFFDALPDTVFRLSDLYETDIITRHHDPERIGTQATPLDADAPNPVHFLVVLPRVRFVFRISPLRATTGHDLNEIWRWLKAALSNLGAGGKTAVGYGEMQPEFTDGAVKAPVPPSDSHRHAQQLIRDLAKNNAAAKVPELLSLLGTLGPRAPELAKQAVAKLTRKWIKGKPWSADLLRIADQ